jgi:CxxC motif-containing protein (DUF1111 family)
MRAGLVLLSSLVLSSVLGACSSSNESVAEAPPSPSSTLTVVKADPTDDPILSATKTQRDEFHAGDRLFDQVFTDTTGLGPLYIRDACGACHSSALKGPGFVQKMARVEADGVTPAADQESELPFGHTIRPYAAGAASTPIKPAAMPDVKVTTRVPPAVFGRGYMEAIDDAEIARVESEQAARADGIHGRINRVTFASEANTDTSFHNYQKGQTNIIGRFGLKARIATLDDFTADAYQGDMNITSPMRPTEVPNPDGLTDDGKPGLDIDQDTVNSVATYMRLLAIPARVAPDPAAVALFDQARCSACHVPSLRTRADYPIPQLAGVDAPVYTDLLLHDMGDALADGLTDGQATSREWKTAPLIGLRFLRNFMHDGRALTVEDAINHHQGTGSQANESVDRFLALSAADREKLVAFVRSL